MDDMGFVGEGGHEFVAASGKFGCGPAFFQGEAGENEHPTTGGRDGPLRGQSLQHPTSGAENDRGIAAQQDAETFLFYW